MQKYLVAALMLVLSVCYAHDDWNPTPADLLRDEVNDTDVFAIPLDQSDVEDDYEIKDMQEEQQEYFDKHPEAYKRWLERKAKRK